MSSLVRGFDYGRGPIKLQGGWKFSPSWHCFVLIDTRSQTVSGCFHMIRVLCSNVQIQIMNEAERVEFVKLFKRDSNYALFWLRVFCEIFLLCLFCIYLRSVMRHIEVSVLEFISCYCQKFLLYWIILLQLFFTFRELEGVYLRHFIANFLLLLEYS